MTSNLTLQKFGKLACVDSGPVPGGGTYTTLVIIHGYGWHGAGFQRLLPFAAKYQVRLVLVNRRDFPGSDPYSLEERAQFSGTAEEAPSRLAEFMCDRAHDVYDFLTTFIQQKSIPKRNGDRGGVILSAWSFGGTWVTAFMAHAPSFTGEVDLTEYIQRAVLYDPPALALGFPFPARTYSPLTDDAIPPAERPTRFAEWVSGYFTHGNTEELLETRTPDTDRTPTILTMTQDEIRAFFSPGPAGYGGSDHALLFLGLTSGANAHMLERTVYPETSTPSQTQWSSVPLHYIWCNRSDYEMPWASWRLQEYIEKGGSSGRPMRTVSITCLEGANHFAHWDEPERLLQALIAAV
ncbi:Alpha/Beta hydrolase protein [Coniochaeta sp. 2T2.1]|nr:Alpha/Beta hydrolase protein [Coniochaeta sp. 2T2.1]